MQQDVNIPKQESNCEKGASFLGKAESRVGATPHIVWQQSDSKIALLVLA